MLTRVRATVTTRSLASLAGGAPDPLAGRRAFNLLDLSRFLCKAPGSSEK